MGFLLTCLSIILTYFSPVELVPSLAPFHVQLVIMIFGLIVSVPVFFSRPIMGLQPPQYLLVLAFWAAIVLSQVTKLKIRWGWEGFYTFGSLVAIYFLVHINTFTLSRIKLVAAAAVTCGVVMGTQSIVAYRTGYMADQLLLFPPGDDRAVFGNRICGFGILHDPNDFAQFLLVCLALLGLFWKRGYWLRNVVLLAPPAAALLYAIYLTFSRGALLGIGAVLLAAVYRKGRNVMMIATAGLALPALYAMRFTGGREIGMDGSTAGRLIAWGAGLSYTIRHPFFGVGFGRFQEVNDLTAHNSFVLCFTELGMFGFFFWVALLYVTLSGLSTLANSFLKNPEDEAYVGAVYAIRAAFCAFLTTGWFLSRTYTETLYILLALAASLIQLRGNLILKDRYRLSWWGPRTLRWAMISMFAILVMVKMKMFA
jgi:O-antigen ligase